MSRSVAFFAAVADKRLFDLLEFYSGDIAALEALGFRVVRYNDRWQAARAKEDILFAWWHATALPVIAAWRLKRKPTIVTGPSDLVPESLDPPAKRFLKKQLVRTASRISSANIAVSQYDLAVLAAVRPRHPRVVYTALDCDFYKPRGKSSTPYAITVGQLNSGSIRRKGIDLAIESASAVQRIHPDFHLKIAGPLDPSGERLLLQLRKEHGARAFELLGEVSRQEKADLLGSAWLYLQPSRLEAFGLAVAEAMACGTVPVVSSRGSLPEIVAGNGIVCHPRTPDTFADAIQALIHDEHKRTSLQQGARRRAEDFSLERHQSAIASLLAELGLRG